MIILLIGPSLQNRMLSEIVQNVSTQSSAHTQQHPIGRDANSLRGQIKQVCESASFVMKSAKSSYRFGITSLGAFFSFSLDNLHFKTVLFVCFF